MKHPTPERGSLVIYIILALVALGLLSVAMTSFFSSSQVSTAKVNCPRQAEYLAESGVRYAMGQLRAASQVSLSQFNDTLTALQTTSAYSVDGTGTFSLVITDASPQYTVTATGTSCASAGGVTATAGPVAFTIHGAYCPGCGADPNTITFEPDADGNSDVDKFPPAGTGGDDGDDMVHIDPDDNTVSLGNGGLESYGCAWYTGDKEPCTNGVCEFGSGLRAYYEIMLSSNTEGDGFVFAIVNADNNTVNDCGGDVNMGELLAYAGSGNTGHGLRAPKLGLEFDFYDNTGHDSVCDVGNRNDRSTSDHVAWIFWGQDYWAGGCNETYDDNRHGAGVWTGEDGTPANADIPTNPENIGGSGAGHDGYYYDTSVAHWMRLYNSSNSGKEFRIRIEVDRAQTANPDGNYCYTLRGWIVKDSETMPEGMDDVSTDYYDPDDQDTWPQVEHMVVLSSTKHGQLDNIIFGWTVATGAATQTVTISDLRAEFKTGETTCPETSKPDDPVVAIPMYEGMGGNVHNTAAGSEAYFHYAYWLKGMSCPGCSAIFFDDAYGPITFWDDATNTMTTAGTVSAWVYLKDHDDYMGILHKGNDSDFGDEAFTLQFTKSDFRVNDGSWKFNPDRITGGGGWGGGGGNNYRIDNGDEKPLFCVNDGGGTLYCVNSQYRLDLDTWYHLAATWDSTADVMEFFVNGVKTATFDATDYGWNVPVVSNAWNELIIGAQTDSKLSFQGMIDDVYLYDRVLTDEEIAALYNDGFLTAQEE